MKITITIVCDSEVPATSLLNNVQFEVIKTEREDTFVLVKREPDMPATSN
jgi:hypothetical protein